MTMEIRKQKGERGLGNTETGRGKRGRRKEGKDTCLHSLHHLHEQRVTGRKVLCVDEHVSANICSVTTTQAASQSSRLYRRRCAQTRHHGVLVENETCKN